LLELVRLLNTALGTQIRATHTTSRPGDVRHSQADISLARTELGYRPHTNLEDGLRRCVEAFGVGEEITAPRGGTNQSRGKAACLSVPPHSFLKEADTS
jgi:dTDP-D-glucose 4,6-dehydratase